MYSEKFLVFSFLLSVALAVPLYDTHLSNEEKKQEEILTQKETPLESNNVAATNADGGAGESDDLKGQEYFYPGGGVWWGHRPWGSWGGWGGYRPWYGWHGWHGWHRPHWGGHWGGPWGGATWGQTKS